LVIWLPNPTSIGKRGRLLPYPSAAIASIGAQGFKRGRLNQSRQELNPKHILVFSPTTACTGLKAEKPAI
jgi:hypothetical protein